MTNQKFTKLVSLMELEMGFIRIPSEYKILFPNKKSRIEICFDKNEKKFSLFTYDPKHQRIYGLTNFLQKAKEQDVLEIRKLDKSNFFISIK